MEKDRSGGLRAQRATVLLATLLVTVAIVATTSPENTGDAVDYARDVASANSALAPPLLEAGHLLWRPAGVVLRDLSGHGPDPDPAAIRAAQRRLVAISVVAAFVLAAAVGLVALEVIGSLPAALLAMGMTALGAAVINFGQAGAPYVPSAALVSLSLWVGIAGGRPAPPWRAALAGALLALGVLLWLPFVLVVCAVILAIFLLTRGEPELRLRAATIAVVSCAVVGMGAYLAAAASNGIRSPGDFARWIAGSSHGISRPGVTRVVIGLPRSFVHMGNDGREVRRYLVGDRLNPVTKAQVARLPLWPKLAAFYLALLVIAWYAVRRPFGRSLLLVGVAAALPVVGLGIAWTGGEEERYLPLYPFLILLVAWAAFSAGRERRRLVPAAATALALLWLTNLLAFNPWVTRSRSMVQGARFGCIAAALDDRSMIVLPQQADPLVTFSRDNLDEPPRSAGATVAFLLPPIFQKGKSWDAILSDAVSSTLAAGGRVWIPAYALDSVPPRWSGWVEGSQSVRWPEVRQAFAALGATRGCSDTGFLEVVATPDTP